MAEDDSILTEDEMAALLSSVDEGHVKTKPGTQTNTEAREYNFNNEEDIVLKQLAGITAVNERFCKEHKLTLFNLLRQEVEVSVSNLQSMKFSEYTHTLFAPTSLNIINIKPLTGSGLVIVDPQLMGSFLDKYFGGGGQFEDNLKGREFTASELLIIRLLLDVFLKDIQTAWLPILDFDFKAVKQETEPKQISIVDPNDIVIVCSFHINLNGSGGELQLVLPYNSLEPYRLLLNSNTDTNHKKTDARWTKSIREELMDAKVEVTANLTEVPLTLNQVIKLKAGDIIPIEMPKQIMTKVENQPMFHASYGENNNNAALKVIDTIVRPKDEVLLPALRRRSTD